MNTLQEFITEATHATDPRVSELVKIRPGGVDPLGLRQINFNLMDQFLPQLNNVARHIRPLTVMAWAWHCAWACAEREKLEEVPISKLRDVVDRIEVIFMWSQLITHKKLDLPGSEYLKTRMPSSRFKFSGDQWTRMQQERKNSTALSAPANYGPSLFNLCFVRRGARRDEVRVHPMAVPAIEALEALLGNDRQHPAFTKFDEVTVKYDELERWGRLWDMQRTTRAERSHISAVLGGKRAPVKRQVGIRLLTTTVRRIRTDDEAALRKSMCDLDPVRDSPELREAALTWRGIQARQLFRLALESMLFWATREVGDGTCRLKELAAIFLALTPTASTASAWLLPRLDPDTVDVVGPLVQLEQAVRDRRNPKQLPASIHIALRAALASCATDSGQRDDRLPLARAQREARSFARKPPADLLQFIFSAWVFGQHVCWSVARGISDARQGTDRILRLKMVPDESGWRLVPGASTSVPNPTPDRLNTAVTLLREVEIR